MGVVASPCFVEKGAYPIRGGLLKGRGCCVFFVAGGCLSLPRGGGLLQCFLLEEEVYLFRGGLVKRVLIHFSKEEICQISEFKGMFTVQTKVYCTNVRLSSYKISFNSDTRKLEF